MTLNENGVLAKIYSIARHIWLDFCGTGNDIDPSRTDLCTLVRTICLGAPLAIIINLATLLWALYALYILIFGLWLVWQAVGLFLLMVTAIAAFTASIIAASLFLEWLAHTETVQEAAQCAAACYRTSKDVEGGPR